MVTAFDLGHRTYGTGAGLELALDHPYPKEAISNLPPDVFATQQFILRDTLEFPVAGPVEIPGEAIFERAYQAMQRALQRTATAVSFYEPLAVFEGGTTPFDKLSGEQLEQLYTLLPGFCYLRDDFNPLLYGFETPSCRLVYSNGHGTPESRGVKTSRQLQKMFHKPDMQVSGLRGAYRAKGDGLLLRANVLRGKNPDANAGKYLGAIKDLEELGLVLRSFESWPVYEAYKKSS